MRTCLLIASSVISLSFSTASLAGQSDTPAAQANADQASALAQAVQAQESAFEKQTRRVGIVAAFKLFASQDALMFLPGPTRIMEKLEGAFWPGDLVWKPDLLVASAAGDMAVSTGPTLWTTAGNPQPGAFLTVWRREGDAVKFILDRGVDVITRNGLPRQVSTKILQTSAPMDAGAAEMMIRAEEAKINASPSDPNARAERLSAEGRVYRNNKDVGVGAEAQALLRQEPVAEAELLGVSVAKSGDLAYTWGRQAGSAKAVYYTRIWIRGDAGWKILIDLTA